MDGCRHGWRLFLVDPRMGNATAAPAAEKKEGEEKKKKMECDLDPGWMDGQQQQHALLESCSAPASAAQRHARTGCTGRGMILPTEADHQAAAQLAVEGARGMTLSHHVLCVADAKSHWPLGGYSTHCALHRRRLERAGGLVG